MLKYLFKVTYVDGTIFKQNREDVSGIDPKRSAFYDVLESGKDIESFSLGKFLDTWKIDLLTGIFTHNGTQFQLEENFLPGVRTLEFFRQHQHDMTQQEGETDHRVIYFLGYSVGEQKFLVGIK